MSETPSPRQVSPIRPTFMAYDSNGSSGNIITPPSSGKRVASPGNTHVSPSLFHQPKVAAWTDYRPETLSPPHSPLTSPSTHNNRTELLGKRLRAKRGLKIQVSGSKLQQYTDYDTSGTSHSPYFSPAPWTGHTVGEPDIQTSLEEIEDRLMPSLTVFDIYAVKNVRAVLKDPVGMERLRHFADSHGLSKDVEFLVQVQKFNERVDLVASTINNVSANFTGAAAISPLRLPLEVGRNLNGDIRDVSNTLLPSLDCLFDDARDTVEKNIAQDVYPGFLKHQVSLRLQTNGPYASATQISGFGEAFCITNPRIDGNPIVYASASLANQTGYPVDELMYKNCHIFQGPSTRGSSVDRMRTGLVRNDEFTELVLNYRKDGSMYWNLVFMARLQRPDGLNVYQLGGQIDVTSMVEREEDLLDVLRYAPPFPERGPAFDKRHNPDSRASCRRSLSERQHERERERDSQARYPPSTSLNKFLRPFRRRHSQIGSPESETGASILSADTSAPMKRRVSIATSTSPPASRHMVASPYSRFMVLEWAKPSKPAGRPDGKGEVVQLPLAYCSGTALECFGNDKQTINDVLGLDIFGVLSEKARSSSVTKSFKSAVREGLDQGSTVKLDITLGGRSRKRSRGVSISRKPSIVGLSGAGNQTPPQRQGCVRRSLSLEALVPGSNGPEAGQDFVSYWTPLQNGQGTTEWVVVILVPDIIQDGNAV